MEMSGLCSFAGCPAAWGQPSTFTAQPLRGGLGGNKHLAALPASKDAVSPSLLSCILYPGNKKDDKPTNSFVVANIMSLICQAIVT